MSVHCNQAEIAPVSVTVSIPAPRSWTESVFCMLLCAFRDSPDTQSKIHMHCKLSPPLCLVVSVLLSVNVFSKQQEFVFYDQKYHFCWVQGGNVLVAFRCLNFDISLFWLVEQNLTLLNIVPLTSETKANS